MGGLESGGLDAYQAGWSLLLCGAWWIVMGALAWIAGLWQDRRNR